MTYRIYFKKGQPHGTNQDEQHADIGAAIGDYREVGDVGAQDLADQRHGLSPRPPATDAERHAALQPPDHRGRAQRRGGDVLQQRVVSATLGRAQVGVGVLHVPQDLGAAVHSHVEEAHLGQRLVDARQHQLRLAKVHEGVVQAGGALGFGLGDAAHDAGRFLWGWGEGRG